MARIFLSHSSGNNAAAIALRDWLISHGWDDLFLDLDPERGLKAGERWQAALKQAAERCELVIFLVSPEWAASKWCLAEFLLAKNLNKCIFGVIVEPTPLSDLPTEMTAEWQLVDLTAGTRDHKATVKVPPGDKKVSVAFAKDGLDRLRIGLMQAGLDARYFVWPPEDDPERAPYRGLEPLQAEDAGIFFGRDGPTIVGLDLLRGLRETAPPRLLVILGASGAGKSSFLRAGLLPRLIRESQHFLPLPVIRPERAVISGETGLIVSLETALKEAGCPRTRTDIREAIVSGPESVASLLRDLVKADATANAGNGAKAPKAPTLILPIDQAEELFHAEGGEEASAFLDLLGKLVATDSPALIALLTIRSDSYERLQEAKRLEGLRQHTLSLPPMPKGSYTEVIKGPARRLEGTRRELKLEEALVDALLADIEAGGAKDALPLLAFTLERLHREVGGDGDLKLSEYEQLGRVKGSIEAAVERALKAADSDPKIPRDREARFALLRRGLIPWLAGIDLDTGSPRRRVARASEIPPESRPLIDLLVEQRLLATDVAKDSGEVTIEPVHEALLRQWGLLQGWLAEDAGLLSLLEGVKRSSRDWVANAKDDGWLAHGGGRLEDAEGLKRRKDLAASLDATDLAYLDDCRAADTARRNRELEEAKKLANANRKVAQRTRIGLFATSFLALAAVGLAVFGAIKAREATRQTTHAQSALAAALIERVWPLADKRQDLATRYALAGLQAAPGNDALGRAALARLRKTSHISMNTGDDAAPAVKAVFDANGSRVVSVDLDGRAFVFDTATGVLVWTVPTDRKVDVAGFSPDGSRLLTVYADGGMSIWDATNREVVAYVVAHRDSINTAEFSPDGARLVTASSDGTVRLWDVNTARLIAVLAGHQSDVFSAAFSASGERLVTASRDETARIWDASTGAGIAVLVSESAVYAAAFSPDGKDLVTASEDLTLRVWETGTGRLLKKIGHSQGIRNISFSTDGQSILADDFAGNFLIWRVVDGSLERAFDGIALGISRGIFRSDGALFVGDGSRGPAIVWEASTGHVIATLEHAGLGGRILAIVPMGGRVVVGLNNGQLFIWDFSRALALLEVATKDACSRLAEEENGYRFSAFEIASDPLIREAWLRGDVGREVCRRQAGGP